MSSEFWAICGLAIVVWLTGERIAMKIEELANATRRPREPNGEDKILTALKWIEHEISDWRYSEKPSDIQNSEK